MQQQAVEYLDNQNTLIGQLIHDNKTSGPGPTVILFPAFEGISEFATDYAKALAKQGYTVLVADMYGNGASADTIDGCMALIKPFLADRSRVRRRAMLAFDTAANLATTDKARIGAIGFCFGGMCVLEIVRAGAALAAGVTAHGVLQKSDLPTAKSNSKLLVLHGYQDIHSPPQELFPFADEMKAAEIEDWTFTLFGMAKHSFTDPRTGSFGNPEQERSMGREYNPTIAERSLQYASEFFAEVLRN